MDGVDIYALGTDVVNLRRRVGMLFQRPNPFPQSVFDNVAFGLRVLGLHHQKNLNGIVEQSLRDIGLWDEVKDNLRQNALNLSLGQQLQQAARVSDWTGFFWLEELVEFGPTEVIFTRPAQKLTEDYITGRAG